LSELGAQVTVIDSLAPGCGANRYNLSCVRDSVRVIEADIGDASSLKDEIASAEVIFNLAGEISHLHSMAFPERDLQINTVAQLRFLLECQASNPGVRIVYAGTRQIYGVPVYLPVDENHPIQPVDFNGVHKYAATMYHFMLARAGALDAVVLRLTNVYGPRMALDIPCQGFLSSFLRRLLLGCSLEVFGDGEQLRDPLYVDDAVEAFLAAGQAKAALRVYNIGGPDALSLREIACSASQAAGVAAPNLRPFPDEIRAIDIGSYATNSARAALELDWRPRTPFREGIQRTLDFYRQELPHYLDLDQSDFKCPLPEHSGIVHRLTYAQSK
jgi:nucleoside-diphosphate-sugar epimerase